MVKHALKILRFEHCKIFKICSTIIILHERFKRRFKIFGKPRDLAEDILKREMEWFFFILINSISRQFLDIQIRNKQTVNSLLNKVLGFF